jgi:hypothetical protein
LSILDEAEAATTLAAFAELSELSHVW